MGSNYGRLVDVATGGIMKRKRWDALADRLPPDRPITGAEIGVWDGRMSVELLRRLLLLTLYMVDRWQPPQPEDSYYDSGSSYARESAALYRKMMDQAIGRTSLFSDRRVVVAAESAQAAAKIRPELLDFAFIDADHSYAGVMRDLSAWVPKVRAGGWICGHDYGHPDQGEVKRAVDEYFAVWPGVIEIDANRTWFYRIPEAQ